MKSMQSVLTLLIISSGLFMGCTQTSVSQAPVDQPSRGKVIQMTNGDLMCYVTLVDRNNVSHDLGATFEICEGEARFSNRQVIVKYETLPVNDCQSNEPCGKTRMVSLISEMELAEQP